MLLYYIIIFWTWIVHSFLKSIKNFSFRDELNIFTFTKMLHGVECTQDIERATEGSVTLMFQLIAITSGVITDKDYLLNFTTFSGTPLRIKHYEHKKFCSKQ